LVTLAIDLHADLIREREKTERLGRALDHMCELLKRVESDEERLRFLAESETLNLPEA